MPEPVHHNSLKIPLIKPIIKSERQEQDIGVIVLRSGEIIEKLDAPRTIHPMVQEEKVVDHSELDVSKALEEEKEQKRKRKEKDKNVMEETQFKPKPLFPQRFTTTQKDQQNADWYEVFPLTEIIQTPQIVEFLKDLCTVKRKIHEYEKAFLNEQFSAILPSKTFPRVGIG